MQKISVFLITILSVWSFGDEGVPGVSEQLSKMLEQLNELAKILSVETPEATGVQEKVTQILGMKKAIYENADAKEEDKHRASDYSFYALESAVRFDKKIYQELYLASVKELLSIYPIGDDKAAMAEASKISIFEFSDPQYTLDLFVETLKHFKEVYPTSFYGPDLVRLKMSLHLENDEVDTAKEIIRRAKEVFVENKWILQLEKLLNLLGTQINFKGALLNGESFDIANWQGKVVLLEFWASWCGPCRSMYPHIRSLYEKYHEEGLEIVGFSLDYKVEALQKYIEEVKIPWTIVYEPDIEIRRQVSGSFGVISIPHGLLVDRRGVITRVLFPKEEMIKKALKD